MHTASCSLLAASVASSAMIENKEVRISCSIDDRIILPQLILSSFTRIESISTTTYSGVQELFHPLNPKIK